MQLYKRLLIPCAIGAAIAIMTTSCLRDDLKPCPALDANFTVEDKCFAGMEDPQEMPYFRDYVPTLRYVLSSPSTDIPVFSSGIVDVTGDASALEIPFDDSLEFGRYTLTAWGGVDEDTPLSDDLKTLTLDPNATMNDIYVSESELDFDADHHTIQANMRRVKGLLTVDSDLAYAPRGLSASVMVLTNLSESVNSDLEYAGAATAHINHKLARMEVCHTEDLLPPTTPGKKTRVSMRFYNPEDPEGLDFVPDDVEIEIRRNEVTSLKYVWDASKHGIIVSLLVDGRWVVIDSMKVF